MFSSMFQDSTNNSRFSIFRYNNVVDNSSQILLNSFLNNKSFLFEAIDQIPYDKSFKQISEFVFLKKLECLVINKLIAVNTKKIKHDLQLQTLQSKKFKYNFLVVTKIE